MNGQRIEAALAQSNGKVSGAHGAAAKLGIPAFNSRIQNSLSKNQQIPVQGSLARTIRSFRESRSRKAGEEFASKWRQSLYARYR